MASSFHSMRRHSFLRIVEADRLKVHTILGPAFAYLDEQEKVYAPAEHGLQFLPGGGADCLKGAPALAQYDRLLAFAFHIDSLFYAQRSILEFRPALRFDCC